MYEKKKILLKIFFSLILAYFGCILALWRESEHGDISNLLNGTRSKVNSEGEFVLTARLEDEDYALQSESESETSSDSEESSFESEDSSDDWIRNFHEKVIFDYKNTQKTFSHTLIS